MEEAYHPEVVLDMHRPAKQKATVLWQSYQGVLSTFLHDTASNQAKMTGSPGRMSSA